MFRPVALSLVCWALLSVSSSTASPATSRLIATFKVERVVGVDAERLYMLEGRTLFVVRSSDGRVVWRRVFSQRIKSEQLARGKLYLLFENDVVLALEARTGRQGWRRVLPRSAYAPSELRVGANTVIVGYRCLDRDAVACQSTPALVGVGLEAGTGKTAWRFQAKTPGNLSLVDATDQFMVWLRNRASTADPGAASRVLVLALPVHQTRLEPGDFKGYDTSSQEDPRPRFSRGNRVYIVGDAETRQPALNANSELGLETLKLPSLRKSTLNLAFAPRAGCGTPEVADVRIDTPPLLSVRLNDRCGELAARWLLGNVPEPFPNPLLSSQAYVFRSSGAWWAVDGGRLLEATTGRSLTRLDPSSRALFVQPNVLLSWIGDQPRSLALRRLPTGTLAGTVQLPPNDGLYRTNSAFLVGNTLCTLFEEQSRLYALPKP